MKEWLKSQKFEPWFAGFVVSLCWGYLFYISSGKFPADKANLISDIKMGAISIIILICNYFFGSSRSSAKKDDSINKMADNKTT